MNQDRVRRIRFSLRTLFVVVAACAIPLTYYPFTEDRAEPPVVRSGLVNRAYTGVRMATRIKPGLIVVVGIEVGLLVGWFAFRQRIAPSGVSLTESRD